MTEPLASFVYEDTDTFQNEMSELYSYSEDSEFFSNRNAFEESMEDCGLPLTWKHMVKEQKRCAIDHLMTMLEVSTRSVRIKSCRALAYIIQGNFGDCLTLDEQVKISQENVFLLNEHGIFQVFVQQLLLEANLNSSTSDILQRQLQHDSTDSSKIFSDSAELRLILSVLCTVVETIYHAKNSDNPKIQDTCNHFVADLDNPYGGELLPVILFQMLNNFSNGTAPHYPVRKISLLLWKILLITLGGIEELKSLKLAKRLQANLPPPVDDVIEVAKTMSPTAPPMVPDVFTKHLKSAIANFSVANKRRVFKQPAIEASMSSDTSEFDEKYMPRKSESDPCEINNDTNQDTSNDELKVDSKGSWFDPTEMDLALNQLETNESETERDSASSDSGITINDQIGQEDEHVIQTDTARNRANQFRDTSNTRFGPSERDNQDDGSTQSAPEDYEWTVNDLSEAFLLGPQRFNEFRTETASTKGLPWKPKVRKADLCSHMSNIRQKYLGYTLPPSDLETTFGFPIPIIEGIRILKKHLYISLSDAQLDQEDIIDKYPLTKGELDPNYRDSPTEKLYCALLPRLPQYLIALLKIMLAASTNNKNKSTERADSLNIVGEVNPEVENASIIHNLKIKADIARHREIIMKATSAIILLLLKHLKINHIYQFEYISQQLMFANCIPLILKFLSQDVYEYVTNPKSNISPLDFPACVIGEQPELTTETLELCSLQPHCWRNMFSCINLARILNKLIKWKQSRIMMLVVFKCQQTLIKSLYVTQPIFQLYILKILKVQLKYLGRPWKKTNMKVVSAVYQKVRHRLTDDWAYSNDNEAKPWDHQSEEFVLQANIHKFHQRRYQHLLVSSNQQTRTSQFGLAETRQPRSMIFNPADKFGGIDDRTDDFDLNESIKALRVSLHFENNHERWLESEVFQRQVNWDKLLT